MAGAFVTEELLEVYNSHEVMEVSRKDKTLQLLQDKRTGEDQLFRTAKPEPSAAFCLSYVDFETRPANKHKNIGSGNLSPAIEYKSIKN